MINAKKILLVSYPKSGNTWLRFILGNLVAGKDAEPVDFYSVHDVIPSIEWKKKSTIVTKGYSFYKSHQAYSRSFRRWLPNSSQIHKAVLLVRNPIDICASYYFYQAMEEKMAIQEYIEDTWKSEQWSQHCLSWLSSPLMKNRLLYVLRYESLLENPARQLSACLDFLGLEFSRDAIEVAIKKSSFENMRQLEDARGRKFKTASRFVRSAGQIKNPICDIDKDEISRLFSNDRWMSHILGYDL